MQSASKDNLSDIVEMTREELAVSLLRMCCDRKIAHCILRDYESLPKSVGHDLDLAVLPRDWIAFEDCLEQLVTEHGIRCVRLDKRSDYYSYALVINPAPVGILKIDIWTDFRWRGLRWLNVEKLLLRTIEWKGLRVASPEYRTLIRVWKDLIYTGIVPDRAKSRVFSEVEQSCDKVKEVATEYLGDYLGYKLIEALMARDWKETANLSRSIRWKLLLRCINVNFDELLDVITGSFAFAFSVVQKILCPYGKMVVLVGPDGSGKTTLANQLLESLPRQLFGQGHYVYSRFDILPELKSIFRASLTKRCGGANKIRAGQPFSMIRAVLMTSYYALDYALGHCKVLFWKDRGHIIIADRYYYDYYLQPHWKNAPNAFLRFCETIVPRPDLILFLYCDSELIYDRKSELDVIEIVRQQEKAKSLMVRLQRGVQVPTDKGKQISLEAAISAILDTLPAIDTKESLQS